MPSAYGKVTYASLHTSIASASWQQGCRFIFAVANASLTNLYHCDILYPKGGDIMANDKLAEQSMNFSVDIINLVKKLKEQRESIISNQIGRSGTSIGANIREAKYAHGTADFITKMQIALKEANETGYWLELLHKTDYISEEQYNLFESKCKSLRAMLVASINTAKNNK
jgi:four helix bundle protein